MRRRAARHPKAAAVLVAAGIAVALVVPTTVAGATSATSAAAARTAPATGLARSGVHAAHGWLVDREGRVVILHGLNQVMKTPPYLPSQDGFGDDDAAFLAANGFDAVRVGVIWGAVEPSPGHIDTAYIAGIARTVATLARHGIVSLLDFHQDLYSEEFGGEGAPAWAVQDGGLPNTASGFPGTYLTSPAEDHAWQQFWSNAPGPDGVGLQDHYAHAWASVAKAFATDPSVAGYEIINEPFGGADCATPNVGCPNFEASTLTAFHRRVDRAIRQVDTRHPIWFEPQLFFGAAMTTSVGSLNDPDSGLAFHDYCGSENVTGNSFGCEQQDAPLVAKAVSRAAGFGIPALITEFGATNDLPNLAEVEQIADANRVGWLEWAYTGHDKTSASPNGQTLVLDPSKPPHGANVLTAKLKVLARPYPRAVAGTPTSWSVSGSTFTLTYSTRRVTGGSFRAGAITDVVAPHIDYPHGYRVSVTGGKVISGRNAPVVQIGALRGARTIRVTITAR